VAGHKNWTPELGGRNLQKRPSVITGEPGLALPPSANGVIACCGRENVGQVVDECWHRCDIGCRIPAFG
jgi:hypothetical protein